MCEKEMADPQVQRLAQAIYAAICKQFDAESPTAPMVCGQGGMRDVLVEGHLDLVKVAAALNKRCCLQMPDIETVAAMRPDDDANMPGCEDRTRRSAEGNADAGELSPGSQIFQA